MAQQFNDSKWRRNITEESMPMDKGFMKDWEKSCTALMNHIKHEQDKKDRENHRELGKLYNMVQDAKSVPSKLAKIVGTN